MKGVTGKGRGVENGFGEVSPLPVPLPYHPHHSASPVPLVCSFHFHFSRMFLFSATVSKAYENSVSPLLKSKQTKKWQNEQKAEATAARSCLSLEACFPQSHAPGSLAAPAPPLLPLGRPSPLPSPLSERRPHNLTGDLVSQPDTLHFSTT